MVLDYLEISYYVSTFTLMSLLGHTICMSIFSVMLLYIIVLYLAVYQC